MKTRVFLLDVESTSLKGRHALRLLLKDEKTKRSFPAYDNSFRPYYYLLPKGDLKSTAKKIVSLKVRDKGKEFGATSVEEVERVIGRKRVKLLKIFLQDPLYVPKLHEATREFGQSYEHRISFAKRFLIDNGLFPCSLCEVELNGRMIKSIKPVDSPAQPEFSTLAFDIEVHTPANAPNPAKDPVIMISAASPGDSPIVISYSKKFSAEFVEIAASEKAAIERFCELLREKKVDLLCSYNGDAFDLPYLRERSKKIHASFYPGRVLAPLRTRQAGIRPVTRVPGRIHYDVYPVVDFLDTVGAVRLPRMTLGHAYAEILGKQKTDINKMDIHKAWDAGGAALEHLAKYNLHDSVACLELAQHTLSLEVELSRLSGETLFDTSRSTTGQLVESLLMRRSFERGEVIPNKPKEPEVQARQQNPIEGAYVKTPEAGVYDSLAMLDFKSMYPSIIISHNIDPFALNCDCCSKDEVHVSPQGHKFCSKIKGLVPTTLEEIVDARRSLQAQIKKTPKESSEYKQLYARQWGLKILANSVAGDEPLVLQAPDGSVRVIEASEFVDPLLSGEGEGETQLGDAPDWNALCMTAGRVCFKPIRKVMRHSTAEPLLQIKLKSGREVKITKDHSVFTLNADGEATPVAGSQLNAGMHLIVPKSAFAASLRQVPAAQYVNLFECLAAALEEELEDIIVTAKLPAAQDTLQTQAALLQSASANSSIELSRRLGMERRNIAKRLQWLEQRGFLTAQKDARIRQYSVTSLGRDYLRLVEEVYSKMNYNGNKRQHSIGYLQVRKALEQAPLELTREFKIGAINGNCRINPCLELDAYFARFLGYYVSEGHCRKWLNRSGGYSYRAEISNTDPKILADMENCMRKTFPFLYVARGEKTLGFNSKIAYLAVKYGFNCGSNAYAKQVPSIILSAPQAIKKEFLQAYFDGDGNYVPSANSMRLTTVSRKLANTLVLLLNQLGVGTVTIRRDKHLYRVFANAQGLLAEARQVQRTRSFADLLPGKLVSTEAQLMNGWWRQQTRKNMSKKTLQRFYAEYSKKYGASKKIEKLLNFLDSDLACDQIAEIKTIPSSGYVYDLSVEDAENFIGGFGLLCLHNSYYGFLGYARARWYSRECAESTTAWARYYIKQAIEQAEKAGFKVLYADTDSALLQFKPGEEKKIEEFRKSVNALLPERMELELEDFYPRGIFVSKKQGDAGAKKKYALINRDGKIKIRGFELVRRDWSRVARRLQRSVLEVLLKEGDVKKAKEMVLKAIEELKAGKTPLEDCVIYTQVRKKIKAYEIMSPEVSALQKAQAAGLPYGEYSTIGYVITRSGKSISEKAQPVELAKDYDADYYVNNQVLPAVLKILGALGVDAEDLKTKGTQKGLGDW